MGNEEAEKLKQDLTQKIEAQIGVLREDWELCCETQLTSRVLHDAAEAAALVLLAFERGYRVGE